MGGEHTPAQLARANLEALEVGAGVIEDRGASRAELEMLGALGAIGWAVLAVAEALERWRAEDPDELEARIRAAGLEQEMLERLGRDARSR